MVSTTAAALLHNTVTRLTLGNTPLHAVPITVAQQLRPLLECSTSLTAFTLHTQFTPPESLRLLLLGASRCRSLQHVRLVGGISVLQSKMVMAAFTHFTLAHNIKRPATARRVDKSPVSRCPHTPAPAPAPAVGGRGSERERERGVAVRREKAEDRRNHVGQCNKYSRVHSVGIPNTKSTQTPSPRSPRLYEGVYVVLDLHHLDDVVASMLLKGLERSERIVGLDVRIAPTSQASVRIASRMLSRANIILSRNAKRVNSLRATPKAPRQATPFSPTNEKEILKSPAVEGNAHSNIVFASEMATGAPREPSASNSRNLPARRYSPPRLLSATPPPPSPQLQEQRKLPYSPPPRRPVMNGRQRFFREGVEDVWCVPKHTRDEGHCTDCFVCSDDIRYSEGLSSPDRRRATDVPNHHAWNNRRAHMHGGSSVQPTPRMMQQEKEQQEEEEENEKEEGATAVAAALTTGTTITTTHASPSPSHCTPYTPRHAPPSPRGQAIQQIRYLRGCVRDINAVVVRFQVVSRESVQRLVTEMRVLEEQLTEKVTAKLTDMMMSLSDMEKQEG
ncbi:uncharacterized protein TM35_000221190 [Trypanosoma theileri]|uniref:Uncharacterized protein n=1 Tax=Trypanosoma theileri TaxID=67003 RepID=A0A1X0NT80_9TRYP|nr:uncharacterized protein TM35_000221190 [Trypanosoma theileri]ORC87320.1 hypothetical protein TM35_000221190 [Trypanosoma theileri]